MDPLFCSLGIIAVIIIYGLIFGKRTPGQHFYDEETELDREKRALGIDEENVYEEDILGLIVDDDPEYWHDIMD